MYVYSPPTPCCADHSNGWCAVKLASFKEHRLPVTCMCTDPVLMVDYDTDSPTSYEIEILVGTIVNVAHVMDSL